MPAVNVSKDALTNVKAALKDYQIDISGFSAKAEQQLSDISKSAEREMKIITNRIEDTIKKINQCKAEINRLDETIDQATNEKARAEQRLAVAQSELITKQDEAAFLRKRIQELAVELEEKPAVADGGSSGLRNIMDAGASGAASPSPLWEPALDILSLATRGGVRGIPPGADGNVAPVAQATWNMGVAGSEELMRGTIRQHGSNAGVELERKQYIAQQIEQMRSRLSQVEAEIRRLQNEISELKERISQLQRTIDVARSEKAKKEDELRIAERLLDRLQNKHERMKSALSKLNDSMNTMLSASKSFETRAVSNTEKSMGGYRQMYYRH
jgi:chromosome segregation ATPase